MEYLEFILYGLIQGLTEFIPVSSTAHLKILSSIMGIKDPGASFSAIIQLGSVFALIWYFRDDIFAKRNSKGFFYKKLFRSIFIATIPIIFLGAFIKFIIPFSFNTTLRSNSSIAIISLLMALLMYFADLPRTQLINIKNHNYLEGLLIGIAQAFAIVPGVSRSGITISVALLTGWNKKDAAKFSFLLGIPAISLVAIVELIFKINQFSSISFLPLIVGLITSFLTSLLAIDFLLKYLSIYGMKLFIYYRVIFGILILLNL